MKTNLIDYMPFIIFAIVIGIVRLLTKKSLKLNKLNDKLNKKYANHHNYNDDEYINLDDQAAGVYLQHGHDDD